MKEIRSLHSLGLGNYRLTSARLTISRERSEGSVDQFHVSVDLTLQVTG